MATRFVDEATAQVAPVYQQQEEALKSQIPAIQQLYQTLFQGLEGQRATETQNILESAGARGVLRSSMPVDLQTQLGTALLAERSKLGAQQAQEIAGVNMKIGELNTQRLNAINQLADTLYNRDLAERKFQMDQEQARQQAASARASSGGGGGSSGSDNPVAPFLSAFQSWIAQRKQQLGGKIPSRQEQDNYVNSLFNQYGIKDRGARQIVWQSINQQFGRTADPTKDWTYKR